MSHFSLKNRAGVPGLLLLLAACGGCGSGDALPAGEGSGAASVPQAPPPPPGEWAGLVGEYVAEDDTLSFMEDHQIPYLLFWRGGGQTLVQADDSTFRMEENRGTVRLAGNDPGGASGLRVGQRDYGRVELGGAGGATFRITPLRPPEELRAEALAASPPAEEGPFLPSDLVELTSLDSTILLDIRYASTDNFMGARMYSSPRAFLQRPAAEALARAHRALKEMGYGVLVHDGYRPWYVTKMFWDATPDPLKDFVADPAHGSRHNRGCAVDLTLYELTTGEPVAMPSGYDEFSPRARADYPGGTSRQRWHRRLLRQVMEAEGFTGFAGEWWHFDFQDWQKYPLENQVFEEIGNGVG